MANELDSPLQWERPSTAESVLLQAMQRLMRGKPELLGLLFHPRRARLRVAPRLLIQEARRLPRVESLLVRTALDLWNQSGCVRLHEIIEELDAQAFEQVTQTLRILGPKPVSPGQPSARSTTRAARGWDSQLF